METKIKIIRLELDFSRTEEYFREHINGGGFLDKSVIEHVDFQTGGFFILMREDAKLEQLYEFSWGGINPKVSTGKVAQNKEGKEYIVQMQLTTSEEVNKFIKKFIETRDTHFALCQDLIQKAQDPPLQIENVKIHFYNDEVYYSLHKENSLKEIDITLGRTDHIWQSLTVLSSGEKLPHLLQQEDFSSICRNAQYILTSAHDGEDFIFWEKR